MSEVTRYNCGNGDGMFDHKNGYYVEAKDYDKLKSTFDELLELAYNECRGLALDRLSEIINKIENK